MSIYLNFVGSHEQSPRLFDSFHYESTDSDIVVGPDSQLKEDLADAMRDCATLPTNNNNRETGELCGLSYFNYNLLRFGLIYL